MWRRENTSFLEDKPHYQGMRRGPLRGKEKADYENKLMAQRITGKTDAGFLYSGLQSSPAFSKKAGLETAPFPGGDLSCIFEQKCQAGRNAAGYCERKKRVAHLFTGEGPFLTSGEGKAEGQKLLQPSQFFFLIRFNGLPDRASKLLPPRKRRNGNN